MIRLSVIMPTNRDNLTAISRIAQACSWAGPHTEVIISDNSGSASKGRLLAQIENENCHIMVGDPCGPQENSRKAFEKAKGDFVMLVCDDDLCFDRGIAALPEKIEGVMHDASVVGIVGTTVVDGARGSSVPAVCDLDADDALARLGGFFRLGMTPPILFSPIRREALTWVTETLRQKPFRFSFDDYISVLLLLSRGRFVNLGRLLYCYDIGNWESFETAQREDLKYYLEASFDPAINKLHWLFCAFEGAVLIRNLVALSGYSLAQRQDMADCWFAHMFKRFQLSKREDLGSPLSIEAEKLCVKWKGAAGQLSFEAILADICEFLVLASPKHAMTYFTYWSSVLDLRKAPAA